MDLFLFYSKSVQEFLYDTEHLLDLDLTVGTIEFVVFMAFELAPNLLNAASILAVSTIGVKFWPASCSDCKQTWEKMWDESIP